MRSLEIAEDSKTKADVVDRYQVKKGRKWDERYNTYLRIFTQLMDIFYH